MSPAGSCLPYRYLGHNSITVVEGLDHNEFLTELHIEYQDLPPGEKLLFDPHTMECLSVSPFFPVTVLCWYFFNPFSTYVPLLYPLYTQFYTLSSIFSNNVLFQWLLSIHNEIWWFWCDEKQKWQGNKIFHKFFNFWLFPGSALPGLHYLYYL